MPDWQDEEEEKTVVEKIEAPPEEFLDETVPRAYSPVLEDQKPQPTKERLIKPLKYYPIHPALPRDRFAAFFIDTFILVYLGFGVHSFLLKAMPGTEEIRDPNPWFLAIQVLVFLILILFYYVFFEGFFGATPGKLACHLRVVNFEGQIPPIQNIFIRNLCRIFDYPLLFLITTLSMETSPLHPSLGDRAGRTIVIKKLRPDSSKLDLKQVAVSSTLIRIFSFAIDLAVFGILIWFYAANLNPAHPRLTLALLLVFPWVAFFYLILFEYFTSTSPGKFCFQRQIVSETGEKPEFAAVFLRNLFRSFDLILAYPLLALTRRKQRLGDLIGETLIVKAPSGNSIFIGLIVLWIILMGLGFGAYQNPNRSWAYQEVQKMSRRGNFSIQSLQGLFPSRSPSVTTSKEITKPPAVQTSQFKPSSTSASLKITEFYFSSGPEPEQIRINGIFYKKDLLFTFFKVTGFKRKPEGQVQVHEDVLLEGPKGEIILNKNNVIEFSETLSPSVASILFANEFTLPPDAIPGTYHLTLVLKDLNDHSQLVAEKTFILQ